MLNESDREYISDLYTEYNDVLYRYIKKNISDRTTIEDILHMVFVQVCCNCDNLKGQKDPSRLLFHITKKYIIEAQDKMRVEGKINHGPIDDIIDPIFAQGLESFISPFPIPAKQLSLLRARYEDKLSYSDIATKFRMSKPAVERMIRSSVDKIRNIYPEFNVANAPRDTGLTKSDNLVLLNDLVDAAGNPLRQKSNLIFENNIAIVNKCLMDRVTADPKQLYCLTSQQFEELVAEMLEKMGYSTKITPATRDGGKDIIIARQDAFSYLFYVECKQRAPDRPVGIDVIQRLYGVISAEHATGGIIATTSYFSRDAKNYIIKNNLTRQLSLQDYDSIIEIINSLKADR